MYVYLPDIAASKWNDTEHHTPGEGLGREGRLHGTGSYSTWM